MSSIDSATFFKRKKKTYVWNCTSPYGTFRRRTRNRTGSRAFQLTPWHCISIRKATGNIQLPNSNLSKHLIPHVDVIHVTYVTLERCISLFIQLKTGLFCPSRLWSLLHFSPTYVLRSRNKLSDCVSSFFINVDYPFTLTARRYLTRIFTFEAL